MAVEGQRQGVHWPGREEFLGQQNEGEEEESEESVVDEIDYSFPDEYKKQFEGLLYYGHLSEEIEIPFHTFRIRTLKAGEWIEVASVVSDKENTFGYNRAVKAATAAGGLISIDGQPLLIGDRTEGIISQKYDYIIANWYQPVIDRLYERVLILEGEVNKVLQKLGFFDDPKVQRIKENKSQ